MPKVNKLKKYVVISRILVLLVIIAAILLIYKMQQPTCVLGELPERFLHDHQVGSFEPAVFESRRQMITENLDADIIIISADVRQDFRYVTGFYERRGIAVIIPEKEEGYHLFVTPWEIYTVMWTGEVYGKEGAMDVFGADRAHALADFEEMLPELLRGKKKIALHKDDHNITQQVTALLETEGRSAELVELHPVLHELRVIKDEWEMAQTRQAADVTVKAHHYAMKTLRPGLREYELQANIEYIFQRNGLSPGFSTIVASGPNTCLLHHRPGDRIMKDGDLVKLDFGAASLGGYIADVTRTIPVNGRFSPKQREIYELVFKASSAAMTKMGPGHRMLDPHHHAIGILVEGLHEMGLIPDTTSWWQKRFYIQHRVNHFIGLNTHDVSDYGYDISDRNIYILNHDLRGREMKPGMVMSNEPALYFMEGLLEGIHEMFGHLASEEELNAFVDEVRPIYEQYEGIGVRIEETVLITADGNINLSAGVPRSVEEIENAMR